jgi:cob(I)alamin adenosyltransferase
MQNLNTTLQTLSDLNSELTATQQQIFKVKFNIANKISDKNEKSSLYEQLFNLEQKVEQIEQKAVKTARILIVVSNKNNQL